MSKKWYSSHKIQYDTLRNKTNNKIEKLCGKREWYQLQLIPDNKIKYKVSNLPLNLRKTAKKCFLSYLAFLYI